jgi:hypothetical protein
MDMQESTKNKDLVSVKLFFDESIYHFNQIWLPPFSPSLSSMHKARFNVHEFSLLV